MILGLNNAPDYAYCWNRKKIYLYLQQISSMMSVAGFKEINRILTVISDKYIDDCKINRECHIIKCMCDLFGLLYEASEHLALDEGMMAFKGQMKDRIYSPLNPDRWKMKFYIIADSELRYILNMRICGQKCSLENTVLDFTEHVKNKNIRLFMDNYYSSFD
jgi:hypothetical protein